MTTLLPPKNANAELQAAWQIYPDLQQGCFVFSQLQHRSRIVLLYKRGDLNRRQQNEVNAFQKILSTIK